MTVEQQPQGSGQGPQIIYVERPRQEWSGMAITSFVLGLIWFWGLGSLIAVILGHTAADECKSGGRRGDGLRLWGLGLGYAGMALTALVVIGLATSAHQSSTYTTPSYGSSYSSSYSSGSGYYGSSSSNY
ncbi:MAG TPA: DUF4190 domain-containing protein [Actinomycetospora sp.]|jgi:hypothetical protein|uniref:DUF4190 domain-containing protein n=1 Tax=Actinomycetospora sp. TaxID=1872135 RepID=UPI002F3E4269